MNGQPKLADRGVPAAVRQERMASAVHEKGFARIGDLAADFGVSSVTVRTDLAALEAHGRVRRVRGGAMIDRHSRRERPFEIAAQDLVPAKTHIGETAAAMVNDGDTVLLDVGTTTMAVARALAGRHGLREVTVITNGLNVASALEPASPSITVVVTGGTVRPLQHSLVNPMANLVLDRVHAAVAFVGCNGIDAAAGVTNVNLPEAEIKRAMVMAARRRVIVADGSKFGRVELAQVCNLSEADLVITDRSAASGRIAEIHAAGCEVRIAEAHSRHTATT